MCHKFSFHGPDLSILGVRVACPKYQGPSSGVQCPRVLDPRVRVLSLKVVLGSGYQVLILDYVGLEACNFIKRDSKRLF